MAPLIAFIRHKKSEAPRACGRPTDYAWRISRLEEQEFYDQNGGLGPRILYRVLLALE